jgi:GTP:adenosylcobinamide-phosphate guanylyltransferase
MMKTTETTDSRYTVLIMAANRHGINNRVARMAGTSHKCVVSIAGVAMIERVVNTIEAWGRAKRILISIEDPAVLDMVPNVAAMRDAGRVIVTQSGQTLTQSVLTAAEGLGDDDFPLLITTGDNVLHTSEILEDFHKGVEAAGADVGFALTARSVVEKAYPEDAPRVGYMTFAEGEHSNCNIYILRSPRVLPVVRTMQHGGQFRHHPMRIVKAFGLISMIKYKLGIARIRDIKNRLERLFGVTVEPVLLPHADAPIDVDTVVSYTLAERILKAREGA